MARRRQTRSPLREKPARSPGESLDEELNTLLFEKVAPLLFAAAYVIVFAALEWWRWFTSAPPHPIPMTVVAILTVLFAALSSRKHVKRAERIRLGLQGEKSVGQFLEANRKPSWRLLHDIPGNGVNVDHVLVAPQGVFAIETKTFSKPLGGNAQAHFDGERLFIDGREPERNAVTQARAARGFIRDLLYEATGMRYPVRGVILLPGWFVTEPKDRTKTDVWVLNPKVFVAFLANEPSVIEDPDVMLAYSRLKNYVTR